MERDKFEPFFESYDNREGSTSGEGSSDKEGLLREFALIGQGMIEFIDGIDSEKLTEQEFTKARYYRYSIAVSLREMSREDFLPANPIHREDELLYLEAGAREAALEYLDAVPNNKAALIVGFAGMKAPDKTHQLLFHQGLSSNIMRFIKKYNPHLKRKG